MAQETVAVTAEIRKAAHYCSTEHAWARCPVMIGALPCRVQLMQPATPLETDPARLKRQVLRAMKQHIERDHPGFTPVIRP